jgi:elongator complex protein 3
LYNKTMTNLPSPREQAWLTAKELTPEKLDLARQALERIRGGDEVFEAIRRYPLPDGGGFIGKSMLVEVYRQLVANGEWESDPNLLAKIRLKPMRTLSGVTTVTVLTKAYPCPGKCIFCPDDYRMPKSYLPDEPGAMRALHHQFDPYRQVAARIETLHVVGHPTNKIELLVLGGTWSSYKKDYQEWFIKRCFEAMNAVSPGQEKEPEGRVQRKQEADRSHEDNGEFTLEQVQSINEGAAHRNVGLVIETRPDHVTPDEIKWLRYLGVTKIQMGVQSLDNHILAINKRGHTIEETVRAVALLRAAGYKIVLHWMPNLLGATPDSDRADFSCLWDLVAPDEIKIYPTQLLEGTELYEHWRAGEFQPYSTDTLVNLVADLKPTIPRYCRVNRVIRDIPSTHVVAGNKRTSLRQDIHRELKRRGTSCECIRCREVRGKTVEVDALRFNDLTYYSGGAEEHFLSWITPDDHLAGFLRLSLPGVDSPKTGIEDLEEAAIIREVHIYGQSLQVGEAEDGAAQHVGLGTRLLEKADEIARVRGFRRIAVISAVGTRRYYLERGFQRAKLYLVKDL